MLHTLYVTNSAVTSDVVLTSTLHNGKVALNHQRVVFTCTANTSSSIIHWSSNEYIGGGGYRLDLFSGDCVGASQNSSFVPATNATCVSVTHENGINIIVSELHITATLQYPTSSVTCSINSHGVMNTTNFSKFISCTLD